GKMLQASHYKHIGLYAFKAEVLREITRLKPGLLEEAESLEQLRWLENGFTIHTAQTDYKMLSVDTPEDLHKAETFYLSR
ncbi:MAG: 3-deoxy-manno-octulosonate cytidylyltransferase, partial [Bacteroidia bacterium]